MKYVEIIKYISKNSGCSYEDALDIFYHSVTRQSIEDGVGNLHCESAAYLADEVLIEYESKTLFKKEQYDRIKAYYTAFSNILSQKQ